MDRPFHLTLYNGYNYLCMLGLKLIFVSKIATGVFLVKCRAYTLYAREQYFHTLTHFNYFTSANNLKTNDMKHNKEQQFRETDSFSNFTDYHYQIFYHFIISINANEFVAFSCDPYIYIYIYIYIYTYIYIYIGPLVTSSSPALFSMSKYNKAQFVSIWLFDREH